MRFLVIVKASKDSEAGVMPSEQLLAEMGNYNEQLVKAAVLQAGEGLHPTTKGVRVRFGSGERTVRTGPFTPTEEQIAGFWIFKCNSLDECIEWVKRAPDPHPGESEIEIRQIMEIEDFGAELTPALREQEDRIRAQAEKNAQ